MGLVDVQLNSRQQAPGVKNILGGRSKRLFDIVFASGALLLTIPILLLVVTILKCVPPRRVLSKHLRLGLGGKSFTSFEFATTAGDAAAFASDSAARSGRSDRARCTALGLFLRESGISKLPELVNVLRGEMSLVGPCPIHPSEVSHYGDRIDCYVSARPGMIGASRTTGEIECPFAEQVAADTYYIENWRFSTDLALLGRVICSVIER